MKDPTFELRRNELSIDQASRENHDGLLSSLKKQFGPERDWTHDLWEPVKCFTNWAFYKPSGSWLHCAFDLGQNKWNIWTTPPSPPPYFNDAKMARFCSFVSSSLLWWRRGLVAPFWSVQDCIWELVTLWIRNLPVDGEGWWRIFSYRCYSMRRHKKNISIFVKTSHWCAIMGRKFWPSFVKIR